MASTAKEAVAIVASKADEVVAEGASTAHSPCPPLAESPTLTVSDRHPSLVATRVGGFKRELALKGECHGQVSVVDVVGVTTQERVRTVRLLAALGQLHAQSRLPDRFRVDGTGHGLRRGRAGAVRGETEEAAAGGGSGGVRPRDGGQEERDGAGEGEGERHGPVRPRVEGRGGKKGPGRRGGRRRRAGRLGRGRARIVTMPPGAGAGVARPRPRAPRWSGR